MIVSDLAHIERQILMTGNLRKAFDFLRSCDSDGLNDGRVEIDGDTVFAIVQRYDTAPADAPKFEYHRKYLDVQFIAAGREIIGWAPAKTMTITEEYDIEKDICFGVVPAGTWTPVCLQAGQLAVLWPEDGHAPKLAAGAQSPVMKIVVKIAV